MDEQDEEARAAAADPPPPGFDAGDVVAASRRITRRRRSALAGGVLAVLAVAGIGLTVGLSGRPAGEATVTSAASAGAAATTDDAARSAAAEAPLAVPRDAQGSGTREEATPAAAAASSGIPGGAVAPVGVPLGPGTGACANRQDPALRALVDQALPETVGAAAAMTTQQCRPGGQRGVGLEVRDGAATGLLSVVYLPPGTAADAAGVSDATGGAWTAPTASGGLVVLVTRADHVGDPPPFAGRLAEAAAYLAPRL